MPSVVELRSVRKQYGAFEALRGVDLDIHEGDVLALLGPNGAGKTTAIGLMFGLRRPTSGEVRLFGLSPTDRRARTRCGVMLQESGVHGALKVRELIALFRTYYPAPLSLERALSLAGLESKADVHAAKLSGGEKQRLYFALAACGDPEVLFLDEPTVGMDVESRRAFLEGIRAFASTGRTLVLTTHYLEEADALAKRVVVIAQGRVIADARPEEIKARVAGRRVRFTTSAALTPADFAGLSVEQLQIRDGQVRLFSARPEDVLAKLFAQGVPMTSLEVVGADLEEAFVSLTSAAKEGA